MKLHYGLYSSVWQRQFTVSQYQVQFDNEPLLSGYTLRATLILSSRLMEVGSWIEDRPKFHNSLADWNFPLFWNKNHWKFLTTSTSFVRLRWFRVNRTPKRVNFNRSKIRPLGTCEDNSTIILGLWSLALTSVQVLNPLLTWANIFQLSSFKTANQLSICWKVKRYVRSHCAKKNNNKPFKPFDSFPVNSKSSHREVFSSC